MFLSISSCGFANQEKPKLKTKVKPSISSTTKTDTMKSAVSQTNPKKSEPVKKKLIVKKNTGKEIKHPADDQKKLDSLQTAKDNGKGIK
jgi:hypothetical protein